MQDFMQLPLLFIWQQQLKSVMHQALTHELSSLPQFLPAESTQRTFPDQAMQPSRVSSQAVAQSASTDHMGSHDSAYASGHAVQSSDATVPTYAASNAAASQSEAAMLSHHPIRDQQASHEPHESLADQAADGTLPQQAATAHTSGQTALETLPTAQVLPAEATLAQTSGQTPSAQGLPQQAALTQTPGQTPSANLSWQGSVGRLPQRAMQGGVPKQATPAQPTFLRSCLAEILRLAHPTQSHFQPLLCGWYTQGALP